jgi:hypothetical protein
MKSILVKLRVLLEGFILWLGGTGLWIVTVSLVHYKIEDAFGIRGGDIFYAVITVILAASVLWILIARRREMGERISTAAYVILNLIPFFATAAYINLWIYSLSG